MQKKGDKVNLRGWEALKIMLQKRGVTGVELEEAQNSFFRGIEVLSRLFLSCYLPERNVVKSSKIT